MSIRSSSHRDDSIAYLMQASYGSHYIFVYPDIKCIKHREYNHANFHVPTYNDLYLYDYNI